MSTKRPNKTAQYLARQLGQVLEERTGGAPAPGGGLPAAPVPGGLRPSFWADAPWRLEPGQSEIPFTFLVRDGQDRKLQLRLEEIVVHEGAGDGPPVHRFTEGLGPITKRLWAYRPAPTTPVGPPPTLPLLAFTTPDRGDILSLWVVFRGSVGAPAASGGPVEIRRPLRIYLASEPLPLRGTAQWYYGDTHHHSSYTSDVKEFGNPVPDTCAAAKCLGLDWLILTDHSVDLADNNPYWEDRLGGGSRWGDLGMEVASVSGEGFRLLRGEELTVLGQPGHGDNTLHMLVFGARFEEMIPGAWARRSLLGQVLASLGSTFRELYEHLFGTIHPLEAALTGVDRNGKAVLGLKGRSVQAQNALAFAAHPTSDAQAPGGTWEYHDLMQPIHGMQGWNGGVRRFTVSQEDPFDHWQPAGPWDDGPALKGINRWDEILRQRAGLEDPRFVLLGGSDAHGSFNYSEGWGLDWDGLRADDNALGKVRTLLYLSHRDPAGPRQAPTEAEVAEAIRSASCVVTNGPVVTLSAAYDGRTAELGQILQTDGDGVVEIEIRAASTAEFGPVEQVEVISYFRGMDASTSRSVPFHVGHSEVIGDALPEGPGYVRLSATTQHREDSFRCFSNPIWIRPAGAGQRSLRVTCRGW
jgi:hypothetical protein